MRMAKLRNAKQIIKRLERLETDILNNDMDNTTARVLVSIYQTAAKVLETLDYEEKIIQLEELLDELRNNNQNF